MFCAATPTWLRPPTGPRSKPSIPSETKKLSPTRYLSGGRSQSPPPRFLLEGLSNELTRHHDPVNANVESFAHGEEHVLDRVSFHWSDGPDVNLGNAFQPRPDESF